VFARQRAIELPSAAPVWLWFLAVSLLTHLWSVNPDTSGDELRALAILVALYLACSLVSVDRRSLAHVEAAIIAGGAVTGLLAAYQLATATIVVSGDGVARFRTGVGGEEGDPNITAATLMLPLVLALARGVHGGRPLPRAASLVAAALIATAIILTASRGGAIAAVVAIGVLAASDARGRTIAVYAGLPVLLTATVLAFAPSTLTDRFEKPGSTGRGDVWRLGLAACPQYCWAGSGWGTFPDVYERQVLASASGKGNRLRFQAHNIVLAMAIEAGLVALALTVLALALTARELVRLPRGIRAPPLAALVGVLVSNMFVANFDYKYFWLVLVYAVLVVEGERSQPQPRSLDDRPTLRSERASMTPP